MPGLFSRIRVFRDLVEHGFFFTQLELKSLLFFFSPDAHFHGLAHLPFAHPASERAGEIAAIPIQDDVSRSQSRFAGGTATVNRAYRHGTARVTLRRKTQNRFLVFYSTQIESGEPEYLLIWKYSCCGDIVSKESLKRIACHLLCF